MASISRMIKITRKSISAKILKWNETKRFVHCYSSAFILKKNYNGFIKKCNYSFCAATSNRETFEKRIVDLLEKEYEEKEFTDNKLPQVILNELTKDFEQPILARISKNELYNLLQSNANSLMPFANLLNHWTVDDDDNLQIELKQLQKDVNYVDIDKKQAKNDEKAAEITKILSDNDLMHIMDTKYLDKYKNNENESNTLYEIGMLYYDISNQSKSIDVYNRVSSIFLALASYLGHVDAQLQLGKQYMLGYGVGQDYKSAIYYFVRSGAAGSIESRTYLGIMYMRGYGMKQQASNMERAYILLSECCINMNPIAERYLAEMYEQGHYIEKDEYIALRLAERACKNGEIKLRDRERTKLYDNKFISEAATICARMYCVHLNDFINGIKYFEIGADLNDVDAQCNLGHIYWIGVPNVVEANIYKAVSYLLKAANKGHKRAHRELGMIYCYSWKYKDIEDLNEGVSWLDLAAKEGYIDCYFRLGEIYASGNNKYNGITQDFKIAKKYFQYARDESDLSKNVRDKLPENIWNLILNNPLQAATLIVNYETLIGGNWVGQYLAHLDPSTRTQ